MYFDFGWVLGGPRACILGAQGPVKLIALLQPHTFFYVDIISFACCVFLVFLFAFLRFCLFVVCDACVFLWFLMIFFKLFVFF